MKSLGIQQRGMGKKTIGKQKLFSQYCLKKVQIRMRRVGIRKNSVGRSETLLGKII